MDLLAHLEAYVATVDENGFSRAADRLGIAQPLLSRRIKTLEEHFGGLLFDRSRRQVTTTEFGVLLLPYARDVLERAERLRHAARAARGARVHTVGVPADCDAAALGRLIRSGADRGFTLGVRELPPAARASGLDDGSLRYALVRVAPENARLHVPLGLASCDTPRPAAGRDRPRTVHLEDLRPRREASDPVGELPLPQPLLLLEEDHVPYLRDRLARAVARAGLPEGVARPAGAAASALAETLAGRARLLCTEPFARRHAAAWTPLADASLHRGYDVGAARDGHSSVDVPAWLTTLLAAAVGAVPGPPGVPGPGAAVDASARLAARG
ncbi:LysR family transcriptional regulator [Streptomyces sp. NPDC047028]|uniref:LysR family transcriptional regulator n=1 Tax=Streptomyces sp. NPDC047028 TaxID=3155793 RepID=UPI00340E19C1